MKNYTQSNNDLQINIKDRLILIFYKKCEDRLYKQILYFWLIKILKYQVSTKKLSSFNYM